MSTSRRTRTPRRALALVLSFAAVAGLAYALAQRTASAARAQRAAASDVKSRPFVPGEILVRFRGETKGAAAAARQNVTALRAASGREIPVEIETPPGLQVVRGLSLARVPAADTLEAVESLRARPDVLYAEPNYVRREFATPNDPSYASQWALKNTGQSQGVAGADIDAEPAWNTTTGSPEVVVGVVDTGIDISHPDLQSNVWTNPAEVPGNGVDDDGDGLVDDVHGWDFFHDDATVFDATGAFPADGTDTHGTHVAGIIGASGNNGLGVAGLDWNVKLLPMKILGNAGESAAPSSVLLTVRAYGYAKTLRDLYDSTNGAKGANLRVLNNSYGGYGESQAERDAIRALNDAGILFVVSSGNDGRSNDLAPVFPAGYNEPNVITVGASTRYDTTAVFTNYGPRTVHMAAPGDEILSTTPGGTYTVASGTSMAAPHVSGAAALVCAADPNISLTKLRAALLFGGDQVQGFAPQSDTFNSTGYVTGRRLNAAGALASAAEPDTTPPSAPGNFRVVSQQGRALNLEWTAPGDDGASGARASLYEIRFTDTDPAALTSAQYQRSYVLFAPLPASAGATQTVTVRVPFRHPTGFVGVRAVDNVGNAGPVAAVAVSVDPDTSDPYTLSTRAAEPLSTGGEKLNVVGDDAYTFNPYQLPFDFTFFGQAGRGLYVSANGVLYLGEPPRVNVNGNFLLDDSISSVPRLAGYRMIAALWDDLRTDLRTGGDVYVVKPDPTRVIFRWQATTYFSPQGGVGGQDENPVNFEVELRRDGTIVKRYGAGNNFVFPVVGISGGDPETYVAASHTSQFSPSSLTNAPTVVYTPRRPTPDPTPDVAVGMLATPSPATAGQLLTYQIEASNRSTNGTWAERTRVTTQVPAGTSLVAVTASGGATVSAPAAGATSGTITIDYGTLFPNSVGASAAITVRVDVPAGSTVTNTATVQSFWQDSDPSNNTATTQTQVVESPPFDGVRALSAGGLAGNSDSHTVALKNDGTVWAWGGGLMGQLGDGATTGAATLPVLAPDITNVSAVSAGGIHTLALKNDGTVWAWGSNQYGQVGVPEQFSFFRTRPVQIPGLAGFVAVAAGGAHSLALKSDGTVWAWGSNTSGQVGNGTFSQTVGEPVQVAGLSNVRAIAAGPNYSLAVKTDGTVWGWGANAFNTPPTASVLGLQNASSTATPVQLAGLSNVVAVAAGGFHAVALKSDGTVVAWGDNQYGQLGDGGASGSTPRAVAGLSNVKAVAAGLEHTVALKNDGTVWAWGRNFSGAVGDGTTVNRNAPVQVQLGAGATAVAAGLRHSGAVLADGTVRTWGANSSGQLGDRTQVDHSSPVQVSGLFPVATPSISPEGGSFPFQTGVIVSTSTPGAVIHYTTNGAVPTEADPMLGSGQLVVIYTTTTLTARAFKPGWPASGVKSATFTFPAQQPQPTPTAVPGAGAQQLAYVKQGSTAAKGSDIFLANLDGTGEVNFTDAAGNEGDPAWSPDGSRIAYTCQRNTDGSATGPQRVCVRNADGTGFNVLTQSLTDDFQPAWSRDGRALAFVSQNTPNATTVSVMNADGTNRRTLNAAMTNAFRPDWSADGRYVAVDYAGSIWAVRVADGAPVRLTSGAFDSQPRYSPDGSKILFQRSEGGRTYIYSMNADGTGLKMLTENLASGSAASWSPDGTKIMFVSLRENPQGPPGIYVMNADGTNQMRVATGGQPAWRRSTNAIDGTGFFVAQHYRDFLHREPDADGLQFWTQGIDSCGADTACQEVKRIDTSAAFFLSIEFKETGYLVYRTYKAAYGNLPGKPVPVRLAEFTNDSQDIGRNVVVNAPGWEGQLESNKQLYFDGFVSTERFGAAFPASMTPAQFVDALNANAGQALSTDERAALVNGLAQGTLTRAQVLRAVAEDADLSKAEFNRAFVLMQYFGYLRRDPDAAPDADFTGYLFWLGKLDEFHGNYIAAEMVKAFLSSAEYRRRFGTP